MKWKKDRSVTPVTSDEIQEYMDSRRGLETDFMGLVVSSRERAWSAAKAGFAFGLLGLAVAGFTMYRYAQPIPEHMITINKDTGEVQEVSLLRGRKTYGQAIDDFWISQYVIHHETYDFYTGENDYEAVGLESNSVVADDYKARFMGKDALDKRLRDSVTKRVYIKSVVNDEKHQIATVRYTTVETYRQRSKPEPPRYYIATLGYEYVNLPMTAAQRYINPLGFRVTSWRNVEEAAGKVGD